MLDQATLNFSEIDDRMILSVLKDLPYTGPRFDDQLTIAHIKEGQTQTRWFTTGVRILPLLYLK
ncbi:hypothetical protein LTR36_005969 [Oleoguttula mirabilis]|uniref:Uncharacterized protein n=1 Tax=Oleoguttula mirabilis TaxID=1507867 RepID=A0AAV9JCK4_9PEZI|nr:hypothetical protein LTR36_005969 [Oleoguttula mirabilis]